MKLHLNSMYGKMTIEPLYADTDSVRRKGTSNDIFLAIEVLSEMKKNSISTFVSTQNYVGNGTIITNSKLRFDTFCSVLIEILQDAERKLNA